MSRFKVGDFFEEKHLITYKNLDDFARLSGDSNPIHMDDNYLPQTFNQRVAHGTYILSLFSKIIGCEYPGYGTVYMAQNITFLKPVYIGTIVLRVTLVKIVLEKYGVLSLICSDLNGDTLIEGEIEVLLPHKL